MYLLAGADGLPIAWCLATPTLGEREVTQALLDHQDHLAQHGWIVLGDRGLAGSEFEGHLAELGALLVRPDRKDEPHRFGSVGGMRRCVESAFDTLKDQLGLERHGGRTLQGVFVRLAQRRWALAACICWNWQVGAPIKRSLIAYDHRHHTHHPIGSIHLAELHSSVPATGQP